MAATDPDRHALATVFLALSIVAGQGPLTAEPLSPEKVIAAAADDIATLVETRYAELEADLRGEHILVRQYLLSRFDFKSTCRLILGRHWKQASPEQRQRFVDAFYRYLLGSYGSALLEFRRDTIRVLPAREAASGASSRVRTQVKLTDGSVFEVDFYMRRDDRGWRVVDVIAEGISYVRTYRSEFGIEMRAGGLDALTARLGGRADGQP